MNEHSDIGRVLRHWFEDGSDTMPDRVVDVVADRIAHKRQRPAWRLLWREADMHPMVKYGAAIAAVLVIAVIGWNLLPGGSSGVGGQPTASPSPIAIPTSTPTATGPVALPDGKLAAGTYRLRPLDVSAPNLTIDAAIPEGWHGYGSWIIAGPRIAEQGGPDGVAVAFTAAEGLRSDPCHWDVDGSRDWDQPGDIEVGPTVDDLAAGFARTAYESTTPADVTLGGFRGKQLDIQLPPDIPDCDVPIGDAEARRLLLSGAEATGFYAWGDATHSQVSIVDVDGVRLIAVLMSHAATPAADLSAAQAILDSLAITP
jgi:hypothetical protein